MEAPEPWSDEALLWWITVGCAALMMPTPAQVVISIALAAWLIWAAWAHEMRSRAARDLESL